MNKLTGVSQDNESKETDMEKFLAEYEWILKLQFNREECECSQCDYY